MPGANRLVRRSHGSGCSRRTSSLVRAPTCNEMQSFLETQRPVIAQAVASQALPENTTRALHLHDLARAAGVPIASRVAKQFETRRNVFAKKLACTASRATCRRYRDSGGGALCRPLTWDLRRQAATCRRYRDSEGGAQCKRWRTCTMQAFYLGQASTCRRSRDSKRRCGQCLCFAKPRTYTPNCDSRPASGPGICRPRRA
jgi:hypothetical protein